MIEHGPQQHPRGLTPPHRAARMRPPFRTRRATRRTLIALALALLPAAVTAPAASADEPVHQPWYFDAMKAEEMWKVAQGEGITVGVIEFGTGQTVPELKGRLLPVKRFDPSAKAEVFNHATSMAALIAGSGAKGGIKGLAPKAKVLPIDIGPYGSESVFYKRLPRAIDYAVDNGAQIINMSFAMNDEEHLPKDAQAAVNRAHGKGVLMFASSGNEGSEAFLETYPAALPGVTRVGAVDERGNQAKFSTSGPRLALAAPGTNITTIKDDGTYHTGRGGTSSASALTSAAAALIWAKHPDWTHNQVLRTLIHTADNPDSPRNDRIGHGPIRPHKVLLEGKGKPGDPDKHPTAAKYYAALDAKAAPTSSDSTSNSTLLIAGGLATAVFLTAGATLHTRRRRNRTTAATATSDD